jgi:addiction module HigA family antidote
MKAYPMAIATRAGGGRRRVGAAGGARPARLAFTSRTPLHPGRFLETRFLAPLAINQTELAGALGISRRRVNEMIRGRRAITPDTAMRLARHFGTDPMFWMQLQLAWDMHIAAKDAHSRNRR